MNGPRETRPESDAPTGALALHRNMRSQALKVPWRELACACDQLTQWRAVTAGELAELIPDRRVKVAGLVLMRQRPSTANGITFVTLEDESGVANLVVYPSVWQHFRQTARFATVIMATGRLQ